MVFQSPWPSQAPYEPLSVPQLIEATVRRLPDKVAMMSIEGSPYTFRQIWDAVQGVARQLQHDGITKGDRVALYAPNSVEYAVAFHAALLAGATVTTLNPLYREREVEHQVRDAGGKAIFTIGPLVPVVNEAKAALRELGNVYQIESVWEMAQSAPSAFEPVNIIPEQDLAVLPYSSGTTGLPKGVMLTHQNLTANVRQTMAIGLAQEDAVMLDFLPFFHIYGLTVLMNIGLVVGATQIVMPRFEPEAALNLISQHKVTDLFAVPPAILAMVHHPNLAKTDLSSLRYLLSGAAPLPLEVARLGAERLGCKVLQGYGMTESSPVTNTVPLDSTRVETVGPPLPDTLEKIVSLETDEELPPGEVGELYIYGPQVMQGYWNNPEATKETLTEDGWLRTGDIASADPDGFIRIHDRKKEMIKYKGYQIAPAELESLLMEHPGVRDAAVIPKADTESGEIPKAFVVPHQAGLDLDQVLAFVAERVAPYKKVRDIEVVEAIPKNPSGKILRRELIEKERARARGG